MGVEDAGAFACNSQTERGAVAANCDRPRCERDHGDMEDATRGVWVQVVEVSGEVSFKLRFRVGNSLYFQQDIRI